MEVKRVVLHSKKLKPHEKTYTICLSFFYVCLVQIQLNSFQKIPIFGHKCLRIVALVFSFMHWASLCKETKIASFWLSNFLLFILHFLFWCMLLYFKLFGLSSEMIMQKNPKMLINLNIWLIWGYILIQSCFSPVGKYFCLFSCYILLFSPASSLYFCLLFGAEQAAHSRWIYQNLFAQQLSAAAGKQGWWEQWDWTVQWMCHKPIKWRMLKSSAELDSLW